VSALFGIDARGLAAFRVAIAALVVVDVALRALDVPALLTDDGVLPRDGLVGYSIQGIARPSLHALSGGAPLQYLLLGLTACTATLLGLGIQSRAATIATWLLLASVQFRNPLVLNGGDLMLRALLFWAMFLPLDLRGRVGSRRSEDTHASVQSMAGAALLLQVVLLYLFAAAHKWSEPIWRGLDAFRVAMTVDGAATPFGQWLGALPVLPELGTASVLAVETIGPVVVLAAWRSPRLRSASVLAFMAFHLLGLATVFRFGLFPFVMVAAWLPFLPAATWDRVESALRGRVARVGANPRRASRVVNAAVGMIFASVVWSNCATIGWVSERPDGPLGFLRTQNHLLGLHQHWSLWSRPPANRYFVIAGRTVSGDGLDLRRAGAPLDFSQAPLRSQDARWWKLELGLTKDNVAPFRVGYACYWLRSWNAAHDDPEHVDISEFWMVRGTRQALRAGEGEAHLLARVLANDHVDARKAGPFVCPP